VIKVLVLKGGLQSLEADFGHSCPHCDTLKLMNLEEAEGLLQAAISGRSVDDPPASSLRGLSRPVAGSPDAPCCN